MEWFSCGSDPRKGPRKAAPAGAAPARWDDVPGGAFPAGEIASQMAPGAPPDLAGNAMQIGPSAGMPGKGVQGGTPARRR